MRAGIEAVARTIARVFGGGALIWHIVAILATVVCVISHFDWEYFSAARHPTIQLFLRPSIVLGFLVPVIIPLTLFIMGKLERNPNHIRVGWTTAAAATTGLLVSWFYKALTGRVHPAIGVAISNVSRQFRFGWLRGGIFWGWPSSHTTVAFAVAITLARCYPKKPILSIILILYALYIAIGVSVSIHWFSDVIAGIIFGTLIGKNFSLLSAGEQK